MTMDQYLLSFLIFTPIAGALLVLILPAKFESQYKLVGLGALLIMALILIRIYTLYDPQHGAGVYELEAFHFVEHAPWFTLDLGAIGSLRASYLLGVDGFSLPLVMLSVVVLLAGVVASWGIKKNLKGYFSLYLLLSGSVMGCFVALDFLLFYLFFEFLLLPMFFLIGLWGGLRREYAAIKFFLYTLLGSVLILIVMVMLYLSVQEGDGEAFFKTFNMVSMTQAENFIPGSALDPGGDQMLWGWPLRWVAFLLLFIGFAIKVPVVPLHTWLPDAHVEAPTAISVVLAGVLLKVGGYGILRAGFLIFPDGAIEFAGFIAVLGLISIIYGGLNALVSKDLKRLVAYSSVAHMGFVVLGLASLTNEGFSGAIYQMVSHGLISSLLFLVAGVLYDRTGDRMIEKYSGLAQKMPRFTAISVLGLFAALGLPGLPGFIAEIMVFLGAMTAAKGPDPLFSIAIPILATLGLIIGAGYCLWVLQRMYFGKFYVHNPAWEKSLIDLTKRESILLYSLGLLILSLGLFPSFLINIYEGTVEAAVSGILETGNAILNR